MWHWTLSLPRPDSSGRVLVHVRRASRLIGTRQVRVPAPRGQAAKCEVIFAWSLREWFTPGAEAHSRGRMEEGNTLRHALPRAAWHNGDGGLRALSFAFAGIMDSRDCSSCPDAQPGSARGGGCDEQHPPAHCPRTHRPGAG